MKNIKIISDYNYTQLYQIKIQICSRMEEQLCTTVYYSELMINTNMLTNEKRFAALT